MDNQNDLGRLRIDIGDHLMNDGADDPLLQARIGRRGGPGGLEVCRERGERSRIDNGRERGGVMGGDLAFNLRHARERLVPARFQSPATSRLAGSAASYCRKARSAAKRAASRSRLSASRT